jgi:hypothetical protein
LNSFRRKIHLKVQNSLKVSDICVQSSLKETIELIALQNICGLVKKTAGRKCRDNVFKNN